jgi:Protein of unknown function (DUF4238)
MTSHKKHHFVPAFLLKEWHAAPANKLYQFRWANNTLRVNERSAKHVAKIEHLYSARLRTLIPDVSLERDYFAPIVDDPASSVHRRLLSNGLDSISASEKDLWSKFLVAQMIRVPSMLAYIRQRGREMLGKDLTISPSGEYSINSEVLSAELIEWLNREAPDMFDDFGLKAIPHIIESRKLNAALLGSDWNMLDLSKSKLDLLIGDMPLIQIGGLAADFLIGLPLSPSKLFLAIKHPTAFNKIKMIDPTLITKLVSRP